ncbi:MAG TPA: hypothetical protein VKA55_05770 [Gammaproteobacteria bacterium]|nr:hypothetical protein [Gammaproteobacteria bacterium]
MLHDFLNGVGNGLALLMGLALLALFILWITLPFLVLQLVRTNRTLTEEVRRLRLLHERPGPAEGPAAGRGEEDRAAAHAPTASEEGHHGE